jgi:hypothetical protein
MPRNAVIALCRFG